MWNSFKRLVDRFFGGEWIYAILFVIFVIHGFSIAVRALVYRSEGIEGYAPKKGVLLRYYDSG